MKERKNKYSVRKVSIGTSSILIATFFCIGGGSIQAAEKQIKNQINSNEKQTQSIGRPNNKILNKTKEDELNVENHEKTTQDKIEGNTINLHSKTIDPKNTSKNAEKIYTKDSTVPQNNNFSLEKKENNNSFTNKEEGKAQNSESNKEIQQPSPQDIKNTKGKVVNSSFPKQNKQINNGSPQGINFFQEQKEIYNNVKKNKLNNNEIYTSEKQAKFQNHDKKVKATTQNFKTETPLNKKKSQNMKTKNFKSDNEQTSPNKSINSERVNAGPIIQPTDKTNKYGTLEKTTKFKPSKNYFSKSKRDKNPKDNLGVLKTNSVATLNSKNKNSEAESVKDQPNKKAKQQEYKNNDPIILVHGFNGFTDDINPAVLSHYWGGDKLNIRQDLEENGYKSYEASISAFGSNYDRAVELYYYIKGGRVDYGAAHAAKYGHKRYGKTYEGVYKDWQPGQKVHLVGHSMGGQTIRELEELLKNGSKEEIEYQKKHGGYISPLFKGKQDNMISTITTLGTPHNGTHASDILGNEAIVRQIVYDLGKAFGNKNSRVDFGLSQWGLKQKNNESYIDYIERVKKSKLWKTKDNGFYDLTREGATDLNRKTSLNPNIVYKTYTGEATHPSLFGRQKADLNIFFPFSVTGNVIGKATEKEWRENDGLVSVISSQHPFNQKYTSATNKIQKGVWQVTPTKHNWDHVDFVGQDTTDTERTREELQQFWHGLAEDLVKSEKVTDKFNVHKV